MDPMHPAAACLIDDLRRLLRAGVALCKQGFEHGVRPELVYTALQ